jgi:hypothetical protein
MKNKRGCRTTALLIGLMLLFTVLSAVLFVEVVDSDVPMYEEGVENEQREAD